MTESSVVIPPFLIGLGIAGLACFVISLWAIVDAVSTPGVHFVAAEVGRGRWIATIVVLYCFTLIGGLIFAIIYLTTIRRKLRGDRIRERRAPDSRFRTKGR